jgi:hypothetical protein
MIGRLVVLGGLALAGAAHAESRPAAAAPSAAPGATRTVPAAPAEAPDPAVEYAADANLESTENRQDLTFAASFGAGVLVGLGIEGPTGRGGSFDLRLGHVATPRTVITFELAGTVVLHGMTNAATYTNTDINALAGAQYYVSESLWLRFAGGLGVYQASHVQGSGPTPSIDVRMIGPAVLGGIGVDIARFKWAVFGVELGTSVMVHSGALVASDLRVGVAFD